MSKPRMPRSAISARARRRRWYIGSAGLFLAAWFGWVWMAELRYAVTCTSVMPPADPVSGYVEIQLREQHPVEPTFSGSVYLYSLDKRDLGLTATTLLRSEVRGYGQSLVEVPLRLDSENQAVAARDAHPLNLIAVNGIHRMFPFDSSDFAFTLTLKPPLHLNAVRITNRVPGFVCDCSDVIVQWSDASRSEIAVTFTLRRSPLVQTFVVILCLASLAFAVAIVMLPADEPFAITTASFFFSIWAVRDILSAAINTFPTLFDMWILTLCSALVLGLLWRAALPGH